MTTAAGRIGPNAIIRLAEVLREQAGAATTAVVFERAGLRAYLEAPPSAMVRTVDSFTSTGMHTAVSRRSISTG